MQEKQVLQQAMQGKTGFYTEDDCRHGNFEDF